MVLRGNCSERDVYKALDIIKNKVGLTHEVPKNKEGGIAFCSTSPREVPDELRECLQEVGNGGD